MYNDTFVSILNLDELVSILMKWYDFDTKSTVKSWNQKHLTQQFGSIFLIFEYKSLIATLNFNCMYVDSYGLLD